MPEHNKISAVARSGARKLSEEKLTAIQEAGSLPCRITLSPLPGGVPTKTPVPGPA